MRRWLMCSFVLAACSSNDTPGDPDVRPRDDMGAVNNADPQTNNANNKSTDDIGTDSSTDVGTDDISFPKEDAGGEEDLSVDPNDPPPPDGWPTGRAWEWVRANPTFVSGLVVRMPAPPSNEMDRYFDDFNANAIHLWQSDYPTNLDGWRTARPNAKWVAWTKFDGTGRNNQIIGGYDPAEPGRIGWQIGDEPRTAADWAETKTGLSAVRAADPDALLIVNYTYQAVEIDRFLEESCGTEQDVVSYDRYTRSHSAYETLALFRDAAIRCGVPYWRYIKSYIDNTREDDIQTESDMRWAAMTGILYGYTGHSWFLYKVLGGNQEGIPTTLFNNTSTWSGSTTERFDWAAKINEELLTYGQAISNLMSLEIRAVPSLIAPEGAPEWQPGDAGDPYLKSVDVAGSLEDVLLGFFMDVKRDRYIVALNPNHSNGSFPTNDDSAIDVTFEFEFDDQVSNDHVKRLTADGTIVNVPVENGVLRATIPAGDILFFKYDSGRPFAGYP